MTVVAHSPRQVVHNLVLGIEPYDEHEAQHRVTTLEWVRSGAPLFRTSPPATPERHLCVYFVLFDEARRSIFLVDHVKAGLWLPPGGHVDPEEDPRNTALREAEEELRIAGEFHPRFGESPLFLTVTKTRGDHSHTDVTLWFVFSADQDMPVEADTQEVKQTRWFDVDDRDQWARGRFEPHMARFVNKLLRCQGSQF